MCQVQAGAYVSLLTPGETKYSDCHPSKTTTYILHVVSITTHIPRRMSTPFFRFRPVKVRTRLLFMCHSPCEDLTCRGGGGGGTWRILIFRQPVFKIFVEEYEDLSLIGTSFAPT